MSIETLLNPMPVCPYCGWICDDPEINDENSGHENDCGECGKTYSVRLVIDYSYTTERMDQNEN